MFQRKQCEYDVVPSERALESTTRLHRRQLLLLDGQRLMVRFGLRRHRVELILRVNTYAEIRSSASLIIGMYTLYLTHPTHP